MTQDEILQQLQMKQFVEENQDSGMDRALSVVRKTILPLALGAYGLRKGAINGLLSGSVQAKGLLKGLKPGLDLATIVPFKTMNLGKALDYAQRTAKGLSPERVKMIYNEAMKGAALSGAGGAGLGLLGNRLLFNEEAATKTPEFQKLSSSNQNNLRALVKLAALGACVLTNTKNEAVLKQAQEAYHFINKSGR